jgi:hypothetical protein
MLYAVDVQLQALLGVADCRSLGELAARSNPMKIDFGTRNCEQRTVPPFASRPDLEPLPDLRVAVDVEIIAQLVSGRRTVGHSYEFGLPGGEPTAK